MDEGFLNSLLRLIRENPLAEGLRSTADAFQQDVDSVRSGGLPRQALRAGEQALGAYNNPLGGVMLPRIPKFATKYGIDEAMDDMMSGKHNVMDVLADQLKGKYRDKIVPSGEYDTMIGTMLDSPALGRVGEKAGAIRRLMNQLAEQSAGGGKTVGAKVFKPGPSGIAKLAKKGSMSETPIEKMWPALIDERSGQVIHTMKPGIGLHERELRSIAESMRDFIPSRGFVDPVTFDAFTEAMLEAALRR